MGIAIKVEVDRLKNMGKGKLLLSPLAAALRDYSVSGWGNTGYDEVLQQLTKIYHRSPYEITDVEEFLNPQLIRALTQLEDKTFAQNICDLVRIHARGQYSAGTRRRSFHSRNFSFYVSSVIPQIRSWIRIYHCDHSIEEILTLDPDVLSGYASVVALEIDRGNPYFLDTIREMIEGENNVLLARQVIIGIIKSENEELREMLLKLLVAAGSQEGLRQAILESADAGSTETFRSIYRCCMEHDLFRFSSAARALYSWSGFAMDDLEIRETRRMAETGWKCLTDPAARQECLQSDHPYDMYFALWAMGCEEVEDTDRMVEGLLDAKENYKKYLGWHFVYHSNSVRYEHAHAIRHLEEEDIGILAAVTDCLHYNNRACYFYAYQKTDYQAKNFEDPCYPADVRERRSLFEKLAKIALRIGHREWVIEGHLFPWSKLVINQENANVLRTMVSLAAYDRDPVMIDRLAEMQDLMNAEMRRAFYVYMLDPDNNERHRQYVWGGLKDRSADNKITALKKLASCKTGREDVRKVCEMFTTKSASVKKEAVNYLKAQDVELREMAVAELFSGKEGFLQVALELMIADEELAERFRSEVTDLIDRKEERGFSDETGVLLEQLAPGSAGSAEEERLLYGVIDEEAVRARVEELKKNYPPTFLRKKEILALAPKKEEVVSLVGKLLDVFVRHADHEYEIAHMDGSRSRVLFGDYNVHQFRNQYSGPGASGRKRVTMSDVPFAEEFREILRDYYRRPMDLAMIVYNLKRSEMHNTLDWVQPFRNLYAAKDLLDAVYAVYGRGIERAIDMMEFALGEMDQNIIYKGLGDLYLSLCHELGEENLTKIVKAEYGFKYPAISMRVFEVLKNMQRELEPDDATFSAYFAKLYPMLRSIDYAVQNYISREEYVRAVDLGVISANEFFDWVLHPATPNWGHAMHLLSSFNSTKYAATLDAHPWLREVSPGFIDAVVRFEAKRGQAETPITAKVKNIEQIDGCEYFCLLLKALGEEPFFRGYYWSNDGTKAASLSSLLKKCRPLPDEPVEKLKALIRETKLKEKRLVEAAMYAPQWAPYIEEIIGWKGLKKAVWLFHAHVSEHFSSEKETEVAIYSPITPQEFNDGVFDIAWFRESYEEMGEKRFKQLYSFAKYITEGSNAHRRSQLYADACLGKLDPDTLEEEIIEKRNQEKLRAYALIPVTEEQLLHRYEFIQNFIKESRQFGAQRRESEKLAGTTAIRNLAIAAGYSDVNRMLWKLEREKNEEIRPWLTPHAVEGYEISLAIHGTGDPEIRIEKAGKVLKTPPKAIAKHEDLLRLKQMVKELKDQKSRGRKTLEDAMINRTPFGVGELDSILASLTIAPAARALVWKCGEHLGYPVELGEEGGQRYGLVDPQGEVYPLSDGEQILVAHPHHLFRAGVWADYMRDVYERQLVQPFKQIFREYYPITEEEKQERTISRRYAGYQVGPKKTVELLKGRGWTVDYEEGLQKVCYGDDLIVRMYAQADWFSPSDIEAPTLEVVQFFRRRTGEICPMEEVNPVTFSEVMRDIDLVVSVAYVGGVEIETSHSTVQMRVALAEELVRLMKLGNVTFTDHHARIAGKLADYSVHMGSGIVHAGVKGAIPILPVHSQHRGRVFLPFADEDPRTAEIMSKIILLAEDTKIKDPEILRMLR